MQGFSCAEYWRCEGKDRPVLSDGCAKDGVINLTDLEIKKIIDLRSSERRSCVRAENITLDASDTKCPGENQVCCKNPDLEAELCRVDKTAEKQGKKIQFQYLVLLFCF